MNKECDERFGEMENSNRQNEIVKAMTDVEFYPTILEKEEVNVESYTKLPLSKISAMGVAFEPLSAAFKNIVGNGGPSDVLYKRIDLGGELVKCADGSYIGAIARGNNQVGGGMAKLIPVDPPNPIVFNPAMLFMAAALMSIDKKLENIQEMQKEIIEFLEQKEKSKLRGNLNFLTEVMNNYKHNWANEKYKNSNHIKVLDIKQDSEHSILFYREQIDRKVKKQSFLHIDKDVKDKLKKVQSDFKEYQLALYLYAFSSFLEVMLLENFEAAYLDGVADKIREYALQYRERYTECYSRIEKDSKSSVESHLLGGLGSIKKVAGNTASKIPVVKKSQIGETLIETGNRLEEFSSKRTTQTMEQLASHQSSEVYSFIENIDTINRLHNQPMELIFDKENIYFSLSEN